MISNKVIIGQSNPVTRAVARFGVGQIVVHKPYNYRGVIIDIDPVFLGTDAWYEKLGAPRPARIQPWYKVLVNDTLSETYVPEEDLQADGSDQQINHPLVTTYFDQFDNGQYRNTGWILH